MKNVFLFGLMVLCGCLQLKADTNAVIDISNADGITTRLRYLLDNESASVWQTAFSDAMSSLSKIENEQARHELEDRIIGLLFVPVATNNFRSSDSTNGRLDWLDNAMERYIGGVSQTVRRWKYRCDMICAMKRELASCKDVKEPSLAQKDPEIAKQIKAELDDCLKRRGFNPSIKVYSVRVSPNDSPTYKRLNDDWHYVLNLRHRIAEAEERLDMWKSGLHSEYLHAPREQRNALVENARLALGRPPKWYPPIDELRPEDAVTRLAHDIESEPNLARHEFGSFLKNLGAMSNAEKRVSLIEATADLLLPDMVADRLYNSCDIEMRANMIASLTCLLPKDYVVNIWALRIRFLQWMSVSLDRYADAKVTIWTSGGDLGVSEVKMLGIEKVLKLCSNYKSPMNDSERQGLDALNIWLRILSYVNQYFDGDDCELKADVSKMTAEGRMGLMKNIEAVLGRPPKWVSAEKQEAR